MPLSLEDNLNSGKQIAIALVEPRIPQNTGNIARLCACTGALLYLVGSLGFRLNDKYLARAGMDYLDDIPIHHIDTYEALEEKFSDWAFFFASTKAGQNYATLAYPDKTVLVFGSETTGLPDWVIAEKPTQSIRIPMRANTRSLNLSNAVAIVLYEVIRQQLMTAAQ